MLIDSGNSCRLRIIVFQYRCPEAIQCDSSVVVAAAAAAAVAEAEEGIATILRCVAAAWTTEVCETRQNRFLCHQLCAAYCLFYNIQSGVSG